MARKFCKTLYLLIEKKGYAPCIKEGCKGHIKKKSTDIEGYSEYCEDVVHYECTAVKNHRWDVVKNNFDESLIFMESKF